MISAEHTGASVEDFARELGATITAAEARALLRVAQDAQGELSQAAMERLTKRPTGTLARSFEVSFSGSADSLSAEVASRLPYAAIQNRGGEVRPVRAKALAIPLDGIPRGMRPREYPGGLHFVPARRGRVLGVLADKAGRPRFALAKSVRITGTHYVELARDRIREIAPVTIRDEIGVSVRLAEIAAGG